MSEAADELERVASILEEPWVLWYGDGGVTVEDPSGAYPRPKLTDWLRARAAAIRAQEPPAPSLFELARLTPTERLLRVLGKQDTPHGG